MNRKIKNIFTLILMTFSLSSFAQTNDEQEMKKQLEQMMKARDEIIKSLLDDNNFQNFDKHFEDMIKKFDQSNLGNSTEMGETIGEYDWRETPTHQIFVLKVKQTKDKPLDIKIEKGQIKFKGDVESVDLINPKSKRSTKVHFERSFSIPAGVDQTNPEFENIGGELLIKFKKTRPGKTAPKIINKDPVDQKLPIDKDADDLTI